MVEGFQNSPLNPEEQESLANVSSTNPLNVLKECSLGGNTGRNMRGGKKDIVLMWSQD